MSYSLEQLQEMAPPETMKELFKRITFTYDAFEALIAAHDEAALTRPLSESGWSGKDYLAHLMVWEDSIVSLLEKKNRMEEMGLTKELVESGDFDAQNDLLYNNHKDRPYNEVLQGLRDTHQHLMNLLADLKDDDLQTPYGHYQPQEEGDYTKNPVVGWIAGDTYSHYAEHVIHLEQLLSVSE
jgi:hypothetical protein